jgi:heat shock protein HtpX
LRIVTLAEARPLDARTRLHHKLRNLLHTTLLVVAMAAMVAVSAWAIWGPGGVLWALIGVMAALALTPSIPPRAVLALYRARPIAPPEFPDGYAVLEQIGARAGLPRLPTLYFVASPVLNAFTLGNRRNAAIALTDGLLRTLTMRELVGVLAHEVSHVRNNDLRIMSLADTLSRFVGVVSFFGLMLLALNLPLLLLTGKGVPWLLIVVLIFAPTIMSLLQLALSRAREYDADLDAAGLTGDPAGLASALRKFELHQGTFWEEIVFPGRRIPEPSLLRTHPPTEERVRRLLDLSEPAEAPMHRHPHDPVALPPDTARAATHPRWRWPGVWY